MRTTAIMNMKGGTAKTVTAINLAAILAHDYALRVLLVDADSQANLTEFVMVLNWKIWEHHGRNEALARVYNDLWQKAEEEAVNTLKGEELSYYYDTLD